MCHQSIPRSTVCADMRQRHLKVVGGVYPLSHRMIGAAALPQGCGRINLRSSGFGHLVSFVWDRPSDLTVNEGMCCAFLVSFVVRQPAGQAGLIGPGSSSGTGQARLAPLCDCKQQPIDACLRHATIPSAAAHGVAEAGELRSVQQPAQTLCLPDRCHRHRSINVSAGQTPYRPGVVSRHEPRIETQ